jgi:hypothetical protein
MVARDVAPENRVPYLLFGMGPRPSDGEAGITHITSVNTMLNPWSEVVAYTSHIPAYLAHTAMGLGIHCGATGILDLHNFCDDRVG